MARMGIVADTISEDFGHAVTRISEWGVPNVELYHAWGKSVCDLTDKELDKAVSLVKEHSLEVPDIASLIMRCPPTDEAEKESFALFDRAVRVAKAFGTDRVRCYAYLKQPKLETVWPRILRTYEKLVKLAEENRVTLLFENSSYANIQYATDLRRFLDVMDHPRLKLLWDPGNGFALGDPTPVVEGYHMLKDRIAHLHLKDSAAHGSNEWVAVGDGAFDLEGFLSALVADRYDGVVSLEAYFNESNAADVEALQVKSIEGLRRAAKKVGLSLTK